MTTTRRKAGFFIQIYGYSLDLFIPSLNRTRRSSCAIRKKIPVFEKRTSLGVRSVYFPAVDFIAGM